MIDTILANQLITQSLLVVQQVYVHYAGYYPAFVCIKFFVNCPV